MATTARCRMPQAGKDHVPCHAGNGPPGAGNSPGVTAELPGNGGGRPTGRGHSRCPALNALIPRRPHSELADETGGPQWHPRCPLLTAPR
jgi:hypothetical protein